MSQVTLKFNLKLEGDFHVGTGYGEKGVADSRQRTDPQGRPMIPKRQFRGLLRDRLEYLGGLYPALEFCDGEHPGSSGKGLCRVSFEGHAAPDDVPCALCRIFGSVATERGFDFSDVRALEDQRVELPEDRKAALAQRELVAQAHVTIDAERRRALGDHLFGIEVARPEGGELESCISESSEHAGYGEALRRDDMVLLVAALRFLRRVGGKRKRGLGRCVVELDLGASCLPGGLQGKSLAELLDGGLKPLLEPPEMAGPTGLPGPQAVAEGGADQ